MSIRRWLFFADRLAYSSIGQRHILASDKLGHPRDSHGYRVVAVLQLSLSPSIGALRMAKGVVWRDKRAGVASTPPVISTQRGSGSASCAGYRFFFFFYSRINGAASRFLSALEWIPPSAEENVCETMAQGGGTRKNETTFAEPFETKDVKIGKHGSNFFCLLLVLQ